MLKKDTGNVSISFVLYFIDFALLLAIWLLGRALRAEFQQVGYSYILPLVAFVLAHFTLSCPFVPACINPAWLEHNRQQKKESIESDLSWPSESKKANEEDSYKEKSSAGHSSRDKRELFSKFL